MIGKALSNIRVLDLSWLIAGPYCTKLLADFGADVVKVERPGTGDPARKIGPFPNDSPDSEKSGVFLHLNTNKRGVTLNLKTETGRKMLIRLVEKANVVVESFSPRVLTSLGLSYSVLEQVNPKLVVTSISNFGQTGPYRDFKMSELVLSAMGSAMRMRGQPEREPLKLADNLLQYQAGSMAAIATMVGFFGSRRSGAGQHIDISLFETATGSIDQRSVALLSHQYLRGKEVSVRIGRSAGGAFAGCPEGIYPCKDGYFDICGGVMWWPRNFALMGSPPELADARFGTQEGQLDPHCQEQILSVFYPWALSRTKNEIAEAAVEARAAVAPLYNMSEVLADPHLRERNFFTEFDHPVAGKLKYPGAPFRPSKTPWQLIRPAPLLGQHNEEVYGELGYNRQDMVQLRESGVI